MTVTISAKIFHPKNCIFQGSPISYIALYSDSEPVILVSVSDLVETVPAAGEVGQEVVSHPPVVSRPRIDLIKLGVPNQ